MGEAQVSEEVQSFTSELLAHLRSLAKRSDGYLSLEEAAAFLGNMPVKTLREKTAAGEIPGYKVGRHVIYDARDLREFVKRRRK